MMETGPQPGKGCGPLFRRKIKPLSPGRANGCGFAIQEALPAVNGPALRRFERHGGFPPALRTNRQGFNLRRLRGALPFRLAGFAALRLVSKALVVKKMLFPCSKDELCSALYAGENAVLEFWHLT
jgi:hypothetical protein